MKSLVAEEVRTLFGGLGSAMLHTYEALHTYPIQHLRCRHDQNAAYAAEGYYKSSGIPGTVMTTSGHGITNMITGITDALMDSMALVVLTTQVPTMITGVDALQDADLVGSTRACTKHHFLVSRPDEIPRIIKEAYYIARSGRPGPVVVDLPEHVLRESASYTGHPKDTSIRGYKPQLHGHPGQIKKAAQLIAKAKRPLICGGGGVIHSDGSEEFRQLVDITQIPAGLTLMGLGAIPTDHPRCLGMVGMYGTYWSNMCMVHCDLMITVGSRFDDRVTGKLSDFGKQCKIIHIDVDPASIRKNVKVDVPIVGDVKHVLVELNRELRKIERNWAADLEEWYAQIEAWKVQHPLRYDRMTGTIKPQYAIEVIYGVVEGMNPIISTGVGQHQMWAAQRYRGQRPRRWLTSGGLGTMGYGLPAAMGAQIAFPNDLVLCIDGDGSFQMSSQDLITCVEYKLPVKVVIINNRYLGMVRQWQELFHNRRYSQVDLTSQPDFVKLAEAYGVTGLRAERPEDVRPVLEKAIATPGPVVVDMITEREENCFPMIPAGAAISDIIDFGEPASNSAHVRPGEAARP